MADRLQQLLRRLREKCTPFQPLAPFLGCLFAVVGELFHSGALRWLCWSIAVLLFVYVTVELASSLQDYETGYASQQGPPKHIPITPFQIFFTLVVAATYFIMIFRVLHSFIDSSRIVFVVMVPVIFAVAVLAAWRNVRLWFREGTDYERALKEQAGQSRKLHIPPVR